MRPKPLIPTRTVMSSSLSGPAERRLCQQSGQRLRQSGRAVHECVLARQGNVVHGHVRRTDRHPLDAVTYHHVNNDIVPGQRRDMRGHVVLCRLGDLGTQVADVHHLSIR